MQLIEMPASAILHHALHGLYGVGRQPIIKIITCFSKRATMQLVLVIYIRWMSFSVANLQSVDQVYFPNPRSDRHVMKTLFKLCGNTWEVSLLHARRA